MDNPKRLAAMDRTPGAHNRAMPPLSSPPGPRIVLSNPVSAISSFLSETSPSQESINAAAAAIRTIADQAKKSSISDTTATSAKAAIVKISTCHSSEKGEVTIDALKDLMKAGTGGNYEDVGSFMVATVAWKALVPLIQCTENAVKGRVVASGMARELRRVFGWGGNDEKRDGIVRRKVSLFLAKCLLKIVRGMYSKKLNVGEEAGGAVAIAFGRALAGSVVSNTREESQDVIGVLNATLKIVLCTEHFPKMLSCVRRAVHEETHDVFGIRVGSTLLTVYLTLLTLPSHKIITFNVEGEPSRDLKASLSLEKIRYKLKVELLPNLLPNLFSTLEKLGHIAFDHLHHDGGCLYSIVADCTFKAFRFIAVQNKSIPGLTVEQFLTEELVSFSGTRALLASDTILRLARNFSRQRKLQLFISMLRFSRLCLASHTLAAPTRIIPTAVRLASMMLKRNELSCANLFPDNHNKEARFRDAVSLRILTYLLQLNTPERTVPQVLSTMNIDLSIFALFVKSSVFANAHGSQIAEECVRLLPYVLDARGGATAVLAVLKRQGLTQATFIACGQSLSALALPPLSVKHVSIEIARGCHRFGAGVFPVVVKCVAQTVGRNPSLISLDTWSDFSKALELVFCEFDTQSNTLPSVATAVLYHGALLYNTLCISARRQENIGARLELPPRARQIIEAALSRSLAFKRDRKCLMVDGDMPFQPKSFKTIPTRATTYAGSHGIRDLREACIQVMRSQTITKTRERDSVVAAELQALNMTVSALSSLMGNDGDGDWDVKFQHVASY